MSSTETTAQNSLGPIATLLGLGLRGLCEERPHLTAAVHDWITAAEALGIDELSRIRVTFERGDYTTPTESMGVSESVEASVVSDYEPSEQEIEEEIQIAHVCALESTATEVDSARAVYRSKPEWVIASEFPAELLPGLIGAIGENGVLPPNHDTRRVAVGFKLTREEAISRLRDRHARQFAATSGN